MYTILVIILVLLLLGALPTWPYSGGWGYYPSGGLGLVLLIVVILLLLGRKAEAERVPVLPPGGGVDVGAVGVCVALAEGLGHPTARPAVSHWP